MRRMGGVHDAGMRRNASNTSFTSPQRRSKEHDPDDAAPLLGSARTRSQTASGGNGSAGATAATAAPAFGLGGGEPRATPSQSILNLVNCLLGAGVLGYPYCFKSCGLLLASAVMVVTLVACRVSYRLLLHASHLSGKRTYEGVAESALGKLGRPLVELCTAALNLGAIVAYLNILADVLSSVAGTLIPPGAEPSRSAFVTGGLEGPCLDRQHEAGSRRRPPVGRIKAYRHVGRRQLGIVAA